MLHVRTNQGSYLCLSSVLRLDGLGDVALEKRSPKRLFDLTVAPLLGKGIIVELSLACTEYQYG